MRDQFIGWSRGDKFHFLLMRLLWGEIFGKWEKELLCSRIGLRIGKVSAQHHDKRGISE